MKKTKKQLIVSTVTFLATNLIFVFERVCNISIDINVQAIKKIIKSTKFQAASYRFILLSNVVFHYVIVPLVSCYIQACWNIEGLNID